MRFNSILYKIRRNKGSMETSANKLNDFIGGRNKLLTEIVDANDVPEMDEKSQHRVILDAYGRWKLVPCKEELNNPNNFGSGDLVNRDRARRTNSRSDNVIPLASRCESREQITTKMSSRPPSEINKTQKMSRTSTPASANESGKDDFLRQAKESYEDLSMYTRSNTIPGQGNSLWRSSCKDAYRGQQITPPWKGKDFYGIKTDDFMQWAESDVYRQRLMKSWGEYQDRINKEGTFKPTTIPSHLTSQRKTVEPREKKNVKKAKKPPIKKVQGEELIDVKQNSTTLIQVKPRLSKESDDNFWEFYDRPFK